MDDNSETSLILGWPFLKIVKARMDTWKEAIILNINRRCMWFRFQPREKYPVTSSEPQETSINIRGGLLRKLKDPGYPAIGCSIYDHLIPMAPCELGSNVNIMPKLIMERINQPVSLSITSEITVDGFYHQIARGGYTKIARKNSREIYLARFLSPQWWNSTCSRKTLPLWGECKNQCKERNDPSPHLGQGYEVWFSSTRWERVPSTERGLLRRMMRGMIGITSPAIRWLVAT